MTIETQDPQPVAVADAVAKALAFAGRMEHDMSADAEEFWEHTGEDNRARYRCMAEAAMLAVAPTPLAAQPGAVPVTLTYTNWRGETAERTIIPQSVWYGSTDWHPEPQWLLKAIDTDKGAERDFALKDFTTPPAT